MITLDSAADDHSGFRCRRLPWTPDFTRPAIPSSAVAGVRLELFFSKLPILGVLPEKNFSRIACGGRTQTNQ